ncbi:phosphopantothenoylcysteine decarboxylase [Gammaproteobacteria bacterium]|nr:phosphopantothenoylcysteine decarboxylase [Gammaproteobacteria bacterium]
MNIVLGVTGSIAAYKALDLVRRLKDLNHDVRVVMSLAALNFITPLSFQAVSSHQVTYDLLDPAHEAGMGHIELARWADLILIAPASANTISKLSIGLADNLLLAVCLAANFDDTKIALAPAMNAQMWRNPIIQTHIASLSARDIAIFGPGNGIQACGELGDGRLLEPLDICALVSKLFEEKINDLEGKHVLISAGPTREAIDPVRYISNKSSGKMGYALAHAALKRGAKVTLISGPVALKAAAGITLIKVESACQMHAAILKESDFANIFIATAAVADYRAAKIASQKIKKTVDENEMNLRLIKNPDILYDVANKSKNRPFCIGFAAETDNMLDYGRDKLKRKNLDMICINDVSNGKVFESDTNAVTILSINKQAKNIDKDINMLELKQADKALIADQILSEIIKLIN